MHISLGELFPDNESLSALDVFDLHFVKDDAEYGWNEMEFV